MVNELPPGELLAIERAMIGLMLAEPKCGASLLPDEFFDIRHQLIWRTILDLRERDGDASVRTLAYALAQHGDLDKVGGIQHLLLCLEEAHIPNLNLGLQRQIREAGIDRKKRQLGLEMHEQGLPDAEIHRRLAELPGPLGPTLFDPAFPWRGLVRSWGEDRIKIGLNRLDEMTGGIGEDDFIVVGARTSHGKTAFLTDLTLRCIRQGISVTLITLEEGHQAMIRRLVGNMAGVTVRKLRDGSITQEEFERCENAVRQLQQWPLTVVTLEEIRSLDEDAVVSAVQHATGKIVILDHLQQILTEDKSRVYGIEKVLRRLQSITFRDHRAMIISAQLSRSMDEDDGRAPKLSDLRDSGAIEQLARQVWLLYWPYKHDATSDFEHYDMYVAKYAEGSSPAIPLRFHAPTGRFSNGEVSTYGRAETTMAPVRPSPHR